MTHAKQLPLFDPPDSEPGMVTPYYNGRDLGTFKDSMRAPVHRWFRYPAGYSYKFVHESFDLFGLDTGDWVYDPFSGTGTTLVCAKQEGINAYGVEAHSFVHWVAGVKLFWDFDLGLLGSKLNNLLTQARDHVDALKTTADVGGIFPDLVYKCYHTEDLTVLYLLREFILDLDIEPRLREFLRLALTDTLRGSAAAGTGWPYISPRKNTGHQPPKDAFKVFAETVWRMFDDLRVVVAGRRGSAQIHNVLGDSRGQQSLPDRSVALALTSPPYLNNYDYADRTRLETYFWGIADSWGEITRKFRDKLIVAATTQVTRSQHQVETALSTEIRDVASHAYNTIQQAVLQLAERRLQKGGRKDYDLMVALYFNAMLEVVKETYRLLEPGAHFCLVLGDSAPYGVHLRTGLLIGQIGLGIGFRELQYDQLRKRGGKWKDNPQRHNIELREGVVILKK